MPNVDTNAQFQQVDTIVKFSIAYLSIFVISPGNFKCRKRIEQKLVEINWQETIVVI